MKKIKIILQFSILLIIVRTSYILKNNIYNSKYDNETKIIGIVNKITFNGNQLKLEINGKEKIIATYNIDEYNEFKLIKNNLKLGMKIKIEGIMEIPKENSNFNLFNYKKYLMSKKIYKSFKIENIELINSSIQFKYKLKNIIIKKIEKSKIKEYLYLFILGENYLDDDIKNNYRNIGISHLFAISGMHISLLTNILFKLLNKIIKKQNINFIIILLFLIFYMFLTNYTASILRASFLFILINFKKIFKLNIKNIDILISIFLLLLLYNPYYIYDVGFLFSFSISYVLIKYNYMINLRENYFTKILMTSLISFIYSIPIMINNFNQINLMTPLINCIFVPLVSLMIFPLALLTFIIPILEPLLNILVYAMENISFICNKISIIVIIPNCSLLILLLYYFIINSILNKFKKVKLLILIIIIFVHSNFKYLINYPIITMIDVGQGDSILIELPHNKANILIDTGGKMNYETEKWKIRKTSGVANTTIIPYLKSIGIKKIDYLILTHGDADHLGEAINLINNFEIKNIFFNSGNDNSLEKGIQKNIDKVNYKKISKYTLNIKEYEFNFINDYDSNNENEDSLITHTKLNNWNILLMGDAGKESEKYLLNEYNLEKVHILKVGHHGSKYSSMDNFINKIDPDISLISVGLNNRFGHPHVETINTLKNSKIYLTSNHGMIKIKLKKQIKLITCL